MAFEIIRSREEVLPYISNVQEAADLERKSFGFLPKSAYADFALQGRLLVAVDEKSREFAGYLAFGGVPPQARIFQTYVAPKARGQGVGDRLISSAVEIAEERSYLSLRASIADDLGAAKEFYRRNGFRPMLEKQGGKTTQRKIVVHVRELATPSLLDLCGEQPVIANTLAITGRSKRSPLYLLDLNVVFDITKRRPNALGAGRLFAAAMENSIQLGISSEFIVELERNWDGGSDPILEMARALPQYRTPARERISEFRDLVGPILFPHRWRQGALTVRDESDIAHLATVTSEGADGFITSEKAILGASEFFERNFGVSMISPPVLGKSIEAPDRNSAKYRIETGELHISIDDVGESGFAEVEAFLEHSGTPASVISEAMALGKSHSPRRHILAQSEEGVCAFASWSPTTVSQPMSRLYLFADERNSALQPILDRLLDAASRDVAKIGPAILEAIIPADLPVTRNMAMRLGFRPSANEGMRAGKLQKLCLGGLIDSRNWTTTTRKVEELSGIELPEDVPMGTSPNELVCISNSADEIIRVPLSNLEDAFSPAIIFGTGRACAITPIKPRYAESLFQGTLQPSLLDAPQAAILREKRFFGDARTYSAIAEGGLLFFYESKDGIRGRGAAIAVARVKRRYLAPSEGASALSREKGVLSAQEVAKVAKENQACVTEFDNLLLFAKPVALAKLKELGCADDTNVVTARKITSSAASDLLAIGVPHV
jgi:GNAT superfamily N-acetyltransferase|tara:strand:- start:901 stop:3066 length:2166 start_codon:yes stop_codon:yes gene_type:complete